MNENRLNMILSTTGDDNAIFLYLYTYIRGGGELIYEEHISLIYIENRY